MELDRAGVLDLGGYEPTEAIAAAILVPKEVVDLGLKPLLADGTFKLVNGKLIAPNFIEAQEASKSDRQRQKESRERRRVLALSSVTNRDDTITNCDEVSRNGADPSQPVTRCHELSRDVTLCSALLSETELSVAERPDNPSHFVTEKQEEKNSLLPNPISPSGISEARRLQAAVVHPEPARTERDELVDRLNAAHKKSVGVEGALNLTDYRTEKQAQAVVEWAKRESSSDWLATAERAWTKYIERKKKSGKPAEFKWFADNPATYLITSNPGEERDEAHEEFQRMKRERGMT